MNRRQGHGLLMHFEAHIAEEVNAGSDRKVSECTAHHSLVRMGLHSRIPVSRLLSASKNDNNEQQNWTTEQWKKMAGSDASHFI